MLCRDCPKLDLVWAATNNLRLRNQCCGEEARDPISTMVGQLVEWAGVQVSKTAGMNRHARRRMQKINPSK